jgi:hypothetical protein
MALALEIEEIIIRQILLTVECNVPGCGVSVYAYQPIGFAIRKRL